jgi:site-specific DNA-methyltransferase (adenine-specific)
VTPHYADDLVTLHHGDCLDVLRTLPDASVDAVVTDPPYGLEFMGKGWDSFRTDDPGTRRWRGDNAGAQGSIEAKDTTLPIKSALPAYGGQRPRTSRCLTCGKRDMMRNPHGCGDLTEWVEEVTRPHEAPPSMLAFGEWCRQWALELYRVLKPGGHLLAFGGTRTWHRLTCGIEDAGFEIRDGIAWLYGSGFPKSMDVSKAIDKRAGVEREREAPQTRQRPSDSIHPTGFGADGWAPQVREPVTAAAAAWRGWGTALKPAFEPVVVARKPLAGTVAGNVLAHGTGALNIDACRVAFASDADERESKDKNRHADFGTAPGGNEVYGDYSMVERSNYDAPGRWPANVVLDDAQAAELDRQSGVSTSGAAGARGSSGFVSGYDGTYDVPYGDTGGASRFFPVFRYEAKAPTVERPRDGEVAHPTVKPLDLMRWLVRLVTPPGGLVLEPFAGSGTTAEACVIEGFRCIAIEREPTYLPLIVARLSKPIQPDLFGGAA